MPVSAPRPFSNRDDPSLFDSGVASLDDWLKRRARTNEAGGASRTFVATDGPRIAGYYAVASGGVHSNIAMGRFRRNMPDPIPVALLGRLAIDRAWQGHGLGRALFRDCAMRVAQAADILGIRGIVVHAISDDAKAFYLTLGFEPSPIEPMTLMVTLNDIRASL